MLIQLMLSLPGGRISNTNDESVILKSRILSQQLHNLLKTDWSDMFFCKFNQYILTRF